MIWLSLLLFIFIFQIATILVLEFRSPGKAVAWMAVLFAVPLIGFVLYYFVAQDYKKRRQLRRSGGRLVQVENEKERLERQTEIIHSVEQMENRDFQGQERLFGLLTRLSGSVITGRNETEIYSSGEPAFHAMLEAMYRARHHIHIEFYIFRDDGIGRQFKQAMLEKARQGITVRLVCDGLGSYRLPKAFVRELEQAGVQVYFFLPPFIAMLDKQVNYRNHRKIVVVDGQVGFVGGLNIGDDYLGLYEHMGYWRDTHLRITGDAVYDLQRTFLGDWQLASGIVISEPGLFPRHECRGGEHVQILTSGPDQRGNDIQEMCFGAIAAAKKRVWITSPYFIPDPSIYVALRTAAIAGVEVKVLLPYHSDSALVKLASLSYVEELMQAGVRFYEYTKGFVHAKVIIVDDLVATVGTANMDMRSFFFNFEMLALLFDRKPIERLEKDFLHDLSNSREIEYEEFTARPRRQKGAELIARLLSPLL